MRRLLPPWVPMIGIEGGRINIVPVDFVADALDHLAHKKGLDGKCFHLTDPDAAPHRRGAQHLRQRRARAADDDAPQRAHVRLHPGADPVRPRLARADQAHGARGADRPRHPAGRVPVHQLADALRQPRGGQGAQGLGHRGAARSQTYAPKLWDYWERHLDPDLFIDRSLAGPRARTRWSWSPAASSGIGKRHRDQARRRRRQGDPGRARRGEAASRPRQEIEAAGGQLLDVHRRRLRPGVVRRAGRARAEGARRLPLPRQQRRPLDPPRRDQLVRPLPRLRADDAAQLLRRAAAHHGLPAGDDRAAARATSSTSRRSACCPTRRASRPTSRRSRRSTRSRRARRRSSSTRASTSRRSTCRWCARR